MRESGLRSLRAPLATGMIVAAVACIPYSTGTSSANPSAAASLLSPQQTPHPSVAIGPPPPAAAPWRSVRIAPEGQVHAITTGPREEFVAVGQAGWNGAVWISRDLGESWMPATVPPVADDVAKSLIGVVSHADGLTAWGLQGGRASEHYQSFIWTSADGQAWTEVEVLQGFVLAMWPRVPGLPLDGQPFVAVGSRAGLTYMNGALAWSSTDGITWTESPPVPGGDQAAISDVVAVADGYIGVGATGAVPGQIRGISWHSSDGITWTPFPFDPTLADSALSDVASNESGTLFAVGSTSVTPEEGIGRPVIWSSADGADWTEAYAPPCCGEFMDIVGYGPVALYRWYIPDGAFGHALVFEDEAGGWNEIGTPEVPDGTVWQGVTMVGADHLFGLAYVDEGGGSYYPVLLVPPEDL
ncbi:MAG: sialidase family protein [Candidatus Limnocylindria bacterium]